MTLFASMMISSVSTQYQVLKSAQIYDIRHKQDAIALNSKLKKYAKKRMDITEGNQNIINYFIFHFHLGKFNSPNKEKGRSYFGAKTYVIRNYAKNFLQL